MSMTASVAGLRRSFNNLRGNCFGTQGCASKGIGKTEMQGMTPFWQAWFQFWLVSMILFALAVAGGALTATEAPFRIGLALVNGGVPVELTPAARFVTGILGGVFLGWIVMMALVLRHAAAMGPAGRPLWLAATVGMLAWYALDSTLSVLTGFALNVVPNSLALGLFLIGVAGSGVLTRSR